MDYFSLFFVKFIQKQIDYSFKICPADNLFLMDAVMVLCIILGNVFLILLKYIRFLSSGIH